MQKTKIITASVIALLLAPAFSFAGENCNNTCTTDTAPVAPVNPVMTVSNDQMQYGNSNAFIDLVSGYSSGTTASGLAVGNNVAAKSQEIDLDVASNQVLNASTGSFNYIELGEARGATVSSSVAQGNVGQIEACCSNVNAEVQQSAASYSDNQFFVAAESVLNLQSSDTVVSNAQAAANNWASTAVNSNFAQHTGQYNGQDVSANSHITACCNNEMMTSGAVAAGNSSQIAGYGATIEHSTEQKNWGSVYGASSIRNTSGTNVTSAVNVSGNTTTLTNEWGWANLTGYQENSGAVSGRSEIYLDDWRGVAASSASSFGNSAILSNIGSDANIGIMQNNFGGGAVNSFAGLYGSSSQNGVGMASSFAVGNAITGFACTACAGGGVKMDGNSQQYNYAPVTAFTQVNTGSAGMISASASAIGNTATYIAGKRN